MAPLSCQERRGLQRHKGHRALQAQSGWRQVGTLPSPATALPETGVTIPTPWCVLEFWEMPPGGGATTHRVPTHLPHQGARDTCPARQPRQLTEGAHHGSPEPWWRVPAESPGVSISSPHWGRVTPAACEAPASEMRRRAAHAASVPLKLRGPAAVSQCPLNAAPKSQLPRGLSSCPWKGLLLLPSPVEDQGPGARPCRVSTRKYPGKPTSHPSPCAEN